MVLSASLTFSTMSVASTFEATFLCVSMTPFGSPVVPDV